MFETADGPTIIRRITTGLVELAKASFRPLRYRAVRRRFLLDFVLIYILIFLANLVGYHEAFRNSAIISIPLALLGAVYCYFRLLRDRDWL